MQTNAASWAAKRALLFPPETVPLLGNVTRAIDEGNDAKFSPLVNVMDKAVTGRDVHDVLTLIGLMTKTPVLSPIGRRIGYQTDVNQGEVNPTSGADYARGMVTGVASKGSKRR